MTVTGQASAEIRAPNAHDSGSGRPRLAVGLSVDHCPHLVASIDQLPAFAATMEGWGVDQIAVGDRVVSGDGMTHPNGGEQLPPPDREQLEPLTLLAAVASCTTDIRLTTGVLLAPLRNPVLLAKVAATLDVLSRGRLDLGVGSGWFQGEFDAIGIEAEDRFARLEETVRICRVLWRDAPASYQGKWTSFTGAYSRPGPYRASGIPIWIGGWPGRVQARRVAKLGDGWIFNSAGTAEDVARCRIMLQEECALIGRDAETIPIRAMLPSAKRLAPPGLSLDEQLQLLKKRATEFVEAGVSHLALPLSSFARDLTEAQLVVETMRSHFAQLKTIQK